MAFSNFQVGIQLVDRGGIAEQGPVGRTPFLSDGGGTSPFTSDANFFDPDGARLLLASTGLPVNLDFRIGGQAFDRPNRVGLVVYTPWASDGGGRTPLITDDNRFDPDAFRVILEARALPAGAQINDVRLNITAVDNNVAGITQFTPWLSGGGGFSPYAFDDNKFDPDGYIIGFEVR
ncbi:hypothetical protein GCM10010329_76560 [Streptomyces spiroverticillatus]|uniref:Uncharacterized protein n=1 Tax=Streptomyces finlayi TaxID=67296 RepID=A0A918X7N3_9ACTN|nr:hypothetical protein [Streptomyces finlayi]GHA42256.1 hypothetical protein GCM10010329_76560 [Streptomyces spiroverticillatus]GHD17104.1 hypothetical protein GCM10010334_78690 [Streptomyces finlayi]